MEQREQYKIKCRRAGLHDAAALTDFAKRTFVETYAAVNDPEDIERYLAQKFGIEQQRTTLSDSGVETWLCEVEDELTGYAELWASPVPGCISEKNLLEIRRFYVDRPWQGRGVASVLIDAILEVAKTRGAGGIWLGVWEHSPRAQAFYRKSGFEKAGEHVFKLGSAMQTDYIMYRSLQS